MGLSIITTPQELWKFGSHERATRGTPISLWAITLENAVALRFSTLRRAGTQAGYQVTAGKTLILTRLYWDDSAAAKRCSIGYSDADLGLSAAADGANAVNLDSPSAIGEGPLVTNVANLVAELDVYFEIPAGKYPRIVVRVGTDQMYHQFFGHEV